jgi:hypothetical protein
MKNLFFSILLMTVPICAVGQSSTLKFMLNPEPIADLIFEAKFVGAESFYYRLTWGSNGMSVIRAKNLRNMFANIGDFAGKNKNYCWVYFNGQLIIGNHIDANNWTNNFGTVFTAILCREPRRVIALGLPGSDIGRCKMASSEGKFIVTTLDNLVSTKSEAIVSESDDKVTAMLITSRVIAALTTNLPSQVIFKTKYEYGNGQSVPKFFPTKIVVSRVSGKSELPLSSYKILRLRLGETGKNFDFNGVIPVEAKAMLTDPTLRKFMPSDKIYDISIYQQGYLACVVGLLMLLVYFIKERAKQNE